MITLEQLDLLHLPAGERLLRTIQELDPRPSTMVATASRLRAEHDPDLVAVALTMHELRSRAAAKFARAGQMWFTRPGLEQATAEAIARHRAQRFNGFDTMADLCSGIGGDLIALTEGHRNRSIVAVDRDPVHLRMAMANAEVYGVRDGIESRLADVRTIDLAGIDAVFIDPARRTERGRTATGASEPPLDWCVGLVQRVPAVGIKTAPGIPHDLVPPGWSLEMIALGADLKEAVLWSPAVTCDSAPATATARATMQATAQATVIRDDGVHSLRAVAGDPVPIRVPLPGDVLYDPNPAVTRAGLVEDLARLLDAAKIDDRIAFLVGDRVRPTPFARHLRVVASEPWNEKALRTRLRELGAGPLDIRRRGLAGDVDAIVKRLRTGTSGDRPLTVAMTRVGDRPWAVICEEFPVVRGS
jgi:hypothetical protein